MCMQHLPPLRVHSVELQDHGSIAAISVRLPMSRLADARLVLTLLVRKWICPEASCSRKIFAECFPGLVQRYARMTDRLVKILQAVGVMTNGADAAQIAQAFGVPTTAKTIIRRVLQLPLPDEGKVAKVGIDEWAWKKGHHYGTLLVDLEKRRVVQLLADREASTSKAWLRKHPEIDLVSRDRSKIFREAATDGAPQAKQVVDRFHLQKNFAQALEKFFRRHTRMLKMAAGQGARKARPATKTVMPPKITPERRARHRQQVSIHKRIWKLYRQGCSKDYIAEIVGLTKRSVYRALKQEAAPPLRRRARSSSVVDPYLPYLASRWNQGCHNTALLYKEIVTQGYTGSQRTLRRQLQTFRQAGEHPVSKQTIILDQPPSARSVALMIVRPTKNRTAEQTAYLERLIQSEATVAVVFTLAQDFGRRLAQTRRGVAVGAMESCRPS
jgi:transposase